LTTITQFRIVQVPKKATPCHPTHYLIQEAAMKRTFLLVSFLMMQVIVAGCMSAGEHRQAVRDNESDRLTVGKVQREIRVGMTSAQVVEALGSPNVVTTDEERREVWVYDKIATERAYSASSGGVSALILGGYVGSSGAGGGGIGPSYSSGAGASSTTQRTLTVIVKFDKESKVRDFAYRQSSF
jgi:outer membrane protein assembly factor BamE (lipoprotein component of BamABCDE complex)